MWLGVVGLQTYTKITCFHKEIELCVQIMLIILGLTINIEVGSRGCMKMRAFDVMMNKIFVWTISQGTQSHAQVGYSNHLALITCFMPSISVHKVKIICLRPTHCTLNVLHVMFFYEIHVDDYSCNVLVGSLYKDLGKDMGLGPTLSPP